MEFGTGRTIRWVAGLVALIAVAFVGIALSRFAGEVDTATADAAPVHKPGAAVKVIQPPGIEETMAARNAVAEDTPAGQLVLAARNGDVARVRELLAEGVPPGAEEPRNGHMGLNQAAKSGQVEVVELLLAAGAAPDAPDGQGLTPLMRAAFTAAIPVGERLLAAGADVNARSEARGETALTQIVSGSFLRGLQGKGGETTVNQRAAELEFARMLFDRGADPNLPSDSGSPLKVLAVSQNTELLSLFVERGARANRDPDLAKLAMMPGPVGEALRTALSADHENAPASGPMSR